MTATLSIEKIAANAKRKRRKTEEMSRLLLSALKSVRDADLVLAPRRKTDTTEWTENVVRAAKTDLEVVTMIEETAIGIEIADEVTAGTVVTVPTVVTAPTAVIGTEEKIDLAVTMTTKIEGDEIMTEIAVIGLLGATEVDQEIG